MNRNRDIKRVDGFSDEYSQTLTSAIIINVRDEERPMPHFWYSTGLGWNCLSCRDVALTLKAQAWRDARNGY